MNEGSYNLHPKVPMVQDYLYVQLSFALQIFKGYKYEVWLQSYFLITIPLGTK